MDSHQQQSEAMANQLLVTPSTNATPAVDDDSLGIDRAFLIQMARLPLIALAFTALSWVAHHIWGATVGLVALPSSMADTPANLGPIIVVCLGMIVAAIIDGWAFKVPNWLTLSLVLSGWMLGALHNFDVAVDAGQGGFGSALVCSLLGFALLFPLLPMRGMGEGDVKMQMGFGSWIGAFYGFQEGLPIVLWAFCAGVIVGGVFGLVMMACRRQFYKNWQNTVEIAKDLKVMVQQGPTQAAKRAEERHKYRVRLPYGVPLCVGFLGYLAYLYILRQ
jgi:prepilin peptidase CpaA